jgi:hypothetical protein
MSDTGSETVPGLRIVAGHPTAEETAAVTVVLAALARPAVVQADRGGQRSAWSDPSRMLRPPVSPGPGAWRASGLPR